ncbi:winged helix DNA-binding domain-containing protein [Dermatophilaceae bacterium Soc4.6]
MTPPAASDLRARRELGRRRLSSSGVTGVAGVTGPPNSGGDDAAADAAGAVARVVGGHLAMQAQDLPGALWSVGVRTGATHAQVLAAWGAHAVTRSWPMRGTLHLVASRDLAWTCALLTTRPLVANRARCTQLGLGDDDLARARREVVRALEAPGHEGLRRSTLFDVLAGCGVDPTGQRGYLLLARFCMEGLLCQGAPQGSEPTFALLEQWAPQQWLPGREEAMATVAQRFVRSHGPVTERDLARWTGQTLTFTREAVALAGDCLRVEASDGTPRLVHVDAPQPEAAGEVHLLPGFDEYLLGYQDRSAMLTPVQEALVVPGGNGIFLPTLVVGGVVAGTWGRRLTPSRVVVTVTPWHAPTAATVRRTQRVAGAYGRFLEREVDLVWSAPEHRGAVP